MVFTSTRNGDMELYTCALDGSDVVQVTSELGYDGGAFFSPDGSQLIWRASRPKTDEEVAHYTELLAKAWLSQRPWNCLLPMLTARMRGS